VAQTGFGLATEDTENTEGFGSNREWREWTQNESATRFLTPESCFLSPASYFCHCEERSDAIEDSVSRIGTIPLNHGIAPFSHLRSPGARHLSNTPLYQSSGLQPAGLVTQHDFWLEWWRMQATAGSFQALEKRAKRIGRESA